MARAARVGHHPHQAFANGGERLRVQSGNRLRRRNVQRIFRADGQVGTRNYWIVLPLVFCENRNIQHLKEALEEELGYGKPSPWRT